MCQERSCLKLYEVCHELTRSRMHMCFVTSRLHLTASGRNRWNIMEQNVSGHHPPSTRPNGKVQKLSWSLALTSLDIWASGLSKLTHSLGPSAWHQFWQPRSGVGPAWTSLDLGLMLQGVFFFGCLLDIFSICCKEQELRRQRQAGIGRFFSAEADTMHKVFQQKVARN